MLKAVLDSLDGVPEAHREFYEEGEDGKFFLKLEGFEVHPAALGLKTNNTKLLREKKAAETRVTELEAKLAAFENVPEDFDADEYVAIKAELEALKKNPNATEQQIEERVKASYEAKAAQEKAKTDRELKKKDDEIAKITGERDQATGQLRGQLIDGALTTALDEAGVTKPAFRKSVKAMLVNDIVVEDEDGEMVARMKPELGGDTVTKYVTGVWAQSEEGKVFVEAAKGGDAPGSKKGGSPGKPNPWDPAHKSIDEQTRIYREDPARAKRLAAEHGVSIG